MSSNNDNKIRKTLLTPCRRVGLKRKSLDITPNTSHDFSAFRSPCTPNTTINTSSAECDTTNTTPVRSIKKLVTQSSGKRLKVRPPAVVVVSTPEPQEDVSMILHDEEKQEDNDADYEKDQENNDIDSLIEKITKRITEKRTEIEKLESDSKNVKQVNQLFVIYYSIPFDNQ